MIIEFKKIDKAFAYSKKDRAFISKIPKTYTASWTGDLSDLIAKGILPNDAKDMREEIKARIRKKLVAIQGVNCIYCGLHESLASELQREHIAPQSKHPEYTFLPQNLALACWRCNKPERKGQKETIAFKRKSYSNCEFQIIHPYFDDFWKYIKYKKGTKVIFEPVDGDFKAEAHILMFDLNNNEHATLRGWAVKMKNYSKLPVAQRKKLEQSRNYKRFC